jgi:hypothetical protein
MSLAESVLSDWKKGDPFLSDVDGFLKNWRRYYREAERRRKRAERELDKQIKRLVWSLTKPLVVCPGGWGDTMPEWMKGEVTLQRLTQNLKGEEGMATDIEALIYLYTASLVAPFNESWTNIYVYLTKKCTEARGKGWPKEIGNPKLTEYQQGLLKHLKEWIWQQQAKRLRV